MTKHSQDHPSSSSISRCEYDDATKDMHITFSSGGRHKFAEVPKEVYDELNDADSKGSYFHQNIRRKYNSTKVD